jgi:hypothetical protein
LIRGVCEIINSKNKNPWKQGKCLKQRPKNILGTGGSVSWKLPGPWPLQGPYEENFPVFYS